jgi:hypothetical protein
MDINYTQPLEHHNVKINIKDGHSQIKKQERKIKMLAKLIIFLFLSGV